jgi:hypothetical protein
MQASAGKAAEAEATNLSQYEARLKLLRGENQ